MAKEYKPGLYAKNGNLMLAGRNSSGAFVISTPSSIKYPVYPGAIDALMSGYEFIDNPLEYASELKRNVRWIYSLLERLSDLTATSMAVANKSIGDGTFTKSLLEDELVKSEEKPEEIFRDEHGIERTVGDSDIRK